MDYRLGKVTSIVDPLKFIIKFTIDNYIEDAIAYPIDTFDEPNEGDPIQVYEIESILGWSFVYKKQRQLDHTRMKLKDSLVDIYEDHVEVHAGDTKSVVKVNADGSLTIVTNSSVSIETGEASIKATKATIEANDVNITGGNLTTVNGGTATPNGQGGFCGIPVCPLTGAPHIGNKISGT